MKKIITLSTAALFLAGITPASAAIVDLSNGSNFSLSALTTVINGAVPLLIAVGIVFFVYALIRFILSAGDEETRTKARYQIIYSIIILAAIIGVWGLVNFVLGAFGLTAGQAAPAAPQGPPATSFYSQKLDA
jgi:hypothetical protein